MLFSPSPQLFFDFGIGFLAVMLYISIGYAILAFIIVMILEAKIMGGYFRIASEKGLSSQLPFITRLKYSFIINAISTIAGILLAVSFQNPVFTYWHPFMGLPNHLFYWLLLALFLTIVIEFASAILLIRPKPSIKEVAKFTIVANLVSYAVFLVLPYIISIVYGLIYAFLYY